MGANAVNIGAHQTDFETRVRPASGFGSRKAWLVMAYAQRLERDADVGVKEAFKVLHQGLSCLAGQITATDSHSAQIAALLTSNWEQLARRLSDIRLDVDETHRVLDARLSIAEKAADYSSSALDHALEKIEAFARQRAMDQAENQRQSNRQELVLERLSDAFLKLEKRLPDANLAQRLEVVEQAVGGMAKPENSAPLLSALQALSHRLEALEKDHGDLLSELRARMFETQPQPAMPQPVEVIELPPLVEPPVVEADTDAAPDFEDLFAEAEPQPLNFLTRARMSARVTPGNAQAALSLSSGSWPGHRAGAGRRPCVAPAGGNRHRCQARDRQG